MPTNPAATIEQKEPKESANHVPLDDIDADGEIHHITDIPEDGQTELHFVASALEDEQEQSDPNSPYNKSFGFKFAILTCISFLSFGSYFAYDAVSALELDIKTDLNISTFQFGLLYSVYSFPNIILVIFGGLLIDKMGNRFSAILFCSLISIGAALVALAPLVRSFYLMLIGRFIFGVGTESSYVVQNNMCVEWFRNRLLAVAMAITISISRLGSVLAFGTEAAVAEHLKSYQAALWLAFGFTFISLLLVFVYFGMDKYAKRNWKTEDEKETTPTFSCSDAKAFTMQYWLFTLIAVSIYGTIFPFLALSSASISEKYGWSEEQTGLMLSTIDITSMILSPLMGWVVDFTGKRGYLVILGNSLAVCGYLLLGLTHWTPILGTILLGFHFCLMPAALWPCVSILVPSTHGGVAFAIVSALINAILSGITPLGGLVSDRYGFKGLCLLFSGVSAFSVFIAIIWNIRDARSLKPVLNVKEKQKELLVPAKPVNNVK